MVFLKIWHVKVCFHTNLIYFSKFSCSNFNFYSWQSKTKSQKQNKQTKKIKNLLWFKNMIKKVDFIGSKKKKKYHFWKQTEVMVICMKKIWQQTRKELREATHMWSLCWNSCKSHLLCMSTTIPFWVMISTTKKSYYSKLSLSLVKQMNTIGYFPSSILHCSCFWNCTIAFGYVCACLENLLLFKDPK